MSMVPVSDTSPIDPDDELLVAYLDGELDNQDRGALEQRLIDEQPLRQRLQMLQQSWDWLDQLPDPAPSEKMVETTLELVVADVAKPSPPGQSALNRYRWPAVTILGCLIAAALGFVLIRGIRLANYSAQLRDLALAEDAGAYLAGADLDLMRDLQQNVRWNQMVNAARELGTIDVNSSATVSSAQLSDRESYVQDLSLDARTRLASRWDAFQRLSPDDKQQIRQTAERVEAQSRSQQLLETMRYYAVWKELLPPGVVDRIEGKVELAEGVSADQSRREAVAQAIDHTMNELSKRSGEGLGDETLELIEDALRTIVQLRLSSGDQAIQNIFNHAHEHWPEQISDRMAYGGAIRAITLADDRWRSSRLSSIFKDNSFQPQKLTEIELRMIESVLPADRIAELDSFAFSDDLYRETMLRAWADAAADRFGFGRHQRPSIIQSYHDLSPSERERIDLMPVPEIRDRLTRRRHPGPPPPPRGSE